MGQSYQLPDLRALTDLVTSSGLPMRQNSRSWIFRCPRCDKDDKLYLRKRDGRFVCWVCKDTEGFQGRPEFALTELLNRPVKELQRILYGAQEMQATLYLDVVLRDFYDDDEDPDGVYVPQPLGWPLDFYPMDHRHAAKGLQYLLGRGVDLPLALKYDLRYCPAQERVMIPIKSGDTLLGWQARSVVKDEYQDPETGQVFKRPKILTFPDGLEKDRLLMFGDRLQGSRHACLVEGPFDGLKLDLCGGNIVTMGKGVSRQQVGLIINSGIQDLYLGLDRDAATEIMKLVDDFGGYMRCWHLQAPDGAEDLGAASLEANLRAFQTAQRLTNATILNYLETDYESWSLQAIKNRERDRTRFRPSRRAR